MTLIKDRTIWRNNGNAVRAQGTYSSLTLITIVLVHCLNFFLPCSSVWNGSLRVVRCFQTAQRQRKPVQ